MFIIIIYLNSIIDLLPTPVNKLPPKRQALMTSIFASSAIPRTDIGVSGSNKKWLMSRQLALMCCQDLQPFNMVENAGFIKFLKQNSVIKDSGDLPARTTLSRGALNTVYDETVAKIKELLRMSPMTLSATTDIWTDNYRRRSYMTVTIHFCLPDFTLQSMVLRTAVFTEAKTGENIKAELTKTLKLFDLENKQIIYVTDQGSNVVKACRLIGSERVGCVAHGLHNLIAVDGVGQCAAIQDIIVRVKNVIKAFTYKTSLLENEANNIAQEQVVSELEDILEAENEEQFNLTSGDSEDENTPSMGLRAGDVGHSSEQAKQSMVTLKKDCPTRWNCLLVMLDSLLRNQQLIERCLSRLRLFDKMLSTEEWETIENLVQFLRVFQTATEVLNGSEYPTISLVLLFRAEITGALRDLPTDGTIVRSMKHNMRMAIDHRLPVEELYVIAAILDPSQRALTAVQEYLTEHNKTAVDILK